MIELVWSEHKKSSSYLFSLVADVIGLIVLLLPPQLEATRLVGNLTLWGGRVPLHLHRRSDGEIFHVRVSTENTIQVVIERRNFLCLEVTVVRVNYHQEGLIYLTNDTLSRFDYETLQVTTLMTRIPSTKVSAISSTHLLMKNWTVCSIADQRLVSLSVPVLTNYSTYLTEKRLYLLDVCTQYQLRVFDLTTGVELQPIRHRYLATDFFVIDYEVIGFKHQGVYTLIDFTGKLLPSPCQAEYLYQRAGKYHLVAPALCPNRPPSFGFYE